MSKKNTIDEFNNGASKNILQAKRPFEKKWARTNLTFLMLRT